MLDVVRIALQTSKYAALRHLITESPVLALKAARDAVQEYSEDAMSIETGTLPPLRSLFFYLKQILILTQPNNALKPTREHAENLWEFINYLFRNRKDIIENAPQFQTGFLSLNALRRRQKSSKFLGQIQANPPYSGQF